MDQAPWFSMHVIRRLVIKFNHQVHHLHVFLRLGYLNLQAFLNHSSARTGGRELNSPKKGVANGAVSFGPVTLMSQCVAFLNILRHFLIYEEIKL